MFDVKLVFSNSPSLIPSPVKSNRRTPKPTSVSALAIREAAAMSLLHVKQCANDAKARAGPAGMSSRAASSVPWLPGKVTRSMRAVMRRRYPDYHRPR